MSRDFTELERDFTDYLNDWHSYPEPYDDQLDAWLHEEYAKIIRQGKDVDWSSIYFSPSSADACPRELYVKAKKRKKDAQRPKPHQRRWASQGTALGDWLQRDLLLAERHYEKLSGKAPRFTIGIINGQPAFEDFVFRQHKMTWNGADFSICGTTDGLMIDRLTGEKIGLEIKSKQETPGKTSLKSMTEPNAKHVKQVVSYGEMYGIDRWLIVYINAAKKKWFATDAELAGTPDVRAFEVSITDDMRSEVFDYFAEIMHAVKSGSPPQLDLDKYRFNNFKRACALDLSDEEVVDLEQQAATAAISGLPEWRARQWQTNVDDIKRIRNGGGK